MNDKIKEYVCLNCGQCMTEQRAQEQMERTGWDKPVCCGGSMVLEDIRDNLHVVDEPY